MDIYEEYSKTKSLINGLTEKLKELEPKLMEEITKAKDPIKNQYGTFTKQTRSNYKFSQVFTDWVYAKKQEIEKKQAEEIAKGNAEKTETISIRYIAPKQDDK